MHCCRQVAADLRDQPIRRLFKILCFDLWKEVCWLADAAVCSLDHHAQIIDRRRSGKPNPKVADSQENSQKQVILTRRGGL